jgi:formate hydrogenlyase subunit 3/multisubunit Na+/H+ antiporter MnhD subunit
MSNKNNSFILNKRITIICALIFRTVLAVVSFMFAMFAVFVMRPIKSISNIEIVGQHNIQTRIVILAVLIAIVAIIIPIVINSIFYSLWFSKKSISKLWVRVPDVIFTLVILIIMCLNLFVFNNNWSEAEWVW